MVHLLWDTSAQNRHKKGGRGLGWGVGGSTLGAQVMGLKGCLCCSNGCKCGSMVWGRGANRNQRQHCVLSTRPHKATKTLPFAGWCAICRNRILVFG